MTERILKFREEYFILGIDLGSAFDTIDRTKQMKTLADLVDATDFKLIELLLPNTSLDSLSFGLNKCLEFGSLHYLLGGCSSRTHSPATRT